jgi:hypothetical protein
MLRMAVIVEMAAIFFLAAASGMVFWLNACADLWYKFLGTERASDCSSQHY